MTGKHKLFREEQESIIRSSAADKEWDICTADPRFIRYLKRQGYELISDYQFPDYFRCRVPFDKVRIRKLKVKATVEQRPGLAKRKKFSVVKQAVARDKIENRTNPLGLVQ